MAKEKTVYVCTNCGQESPKWAGKCPSCGQWNTFVEEVVRKEAPVAKHVAHGIESIRSKPQLLHEITAGEEQRIDMGDEELNRVLGGGCRRISNPNRWRTWHWKINPYSTNCFTPFPEKSTLHFRRRKRTSAQTPCRPYSSSGKLRLIDCL